MRSILDGFAVMARDLIRGDWRAWWAANVSPDRTMRVILDACTSYVQRDEDLHREASARAAELRVTYERKLAAGELRGVQPANERDRVEWHERGAEKHARSARAYSRLAAKVQAEGLPAEILEYQPLGRAW
jgi:hypothetical protein